MSAKIFSGWRSRSLTLLIVFFILSCAHQVAPTGGPVDKTPPEIVRTFPQPRSLHYRDSRIVLEFSKYVDRRSVEESIFISPSLGALAFDWSGTETEIHFAKAVRESTTYVVTVGTDVVDLRNHNRMANAYPLAFSTGDHIDSGSIGGKVFDAKPEGIMMFAYLLDGINADTLNPTRDFSDYQTQTGKDGSFRLSFLRMGRYRVIAVRDEYKNFVYDVQTDEYGVAPGDFLLSGDHPAIQNAQFRMAKEDTAEPFLSSARAIDARHVILKFSKQVDTSAFDSRNVSIVDSLKGDTLEVENVSFALAARPQAMGERSKFPDAYLVTGAQESTSAYRVTLRNVKDLFGNVMSEKMGQTVFAGSSIPDTMKPLIAEINVQEGSKSFDAGDSIRLSFSKAIIASTFTLGFALYDSGGVNVPCKAVWWNAMAAAFVPRTALVYGLKYKISVVLDSLVDFEGNGWKDSSKVFRFSTVSEDVLGSLSGTVDDDQSLTRGRIIVTAASVSSMDAKPRLVTVQRPGPFVFENLHEGLYVLSAYNDLDTNGVYSYGKPYPYAGSERFTLYPDTIKVRARWPVEGVAIHFR